MSQYLQWYRRAREEAERRWGDGFQGLSWGSMVYACQGKLRDPNTGPTASCGWEHRVLLGVGVEGPPDMKSVEAIIPCPFFCGRCPQCGGSLAHDRWTEDEEWEPRERDPEMAYFYVPSSRRARKNAEVNYGGAEYNDPTGRTN